MIIIDIDDLEADCGRQLEVHAPRRQDGCWRCRVRWQNVDLAEVDGAGASPTQALVNAITMIEHTILGSGQTLLCQGEPLAVMISASLVPDLPL